MNDTETASGKKAFYSDPRIRPSVLPPRFDGIHPGLRAERRWMLWSLALDNKGRWTKVPKGIGGCGIDHTNSKLWVEFDEACKAYRRGGFDGLGFALGDGIVGVDLDDARDPQSGAAETWAAEIAVRLGGYCEVSPSRTGFKIFTRGEWRGDWHRRPCERGEVEVYPSGRYFCVTGVSP